MALSAEHLRELSTLAWSRQPQKYSVDRLFRVLGEHEDGDFRGSSELIRIMLRDARLSSCLATRVNALLGCKEDLVAPEGQERRGRRLIADVGRWWWTVLDESTRAQLLVWGLMAGVGIATMAWDMSPDRLTPKSVRALPNDGLFWDDQSRKLYYQFDGGLVEEVVHGDGKWIVFSPYGYRSWTQGKVMSLADCWLMRQWTRRDWARRNELVGQGIIKGTTPPGALPPAQDTWAAKLRRMGSSGVIVCPKSADGSGYDATLIEAKADGHDLFSSFIAQQNVDIAVGLLGQNLTTEVPSGGVFGTTAHGAVRQDYLEWDSRSEADCLRSGAIVPCVVVNGGEEALAPWPERHTDPPEDEKAKAETRKTQVETIAAAKQLSPRVDVDRELEAIGYELLDPSEMPEAAPAPAPELPPNDGPAGDTPADPAPATTNSARVLLAEPKADAAFITGQKYVNGLVDAATILAQPHIVGLLKQIQAAVDASSSYDELRVRLIELAGSNPSPEAEDLFERAILLGLGQGTYSATVEADATS